MTRCQRDCHTPTAVPAPAGIDYASLTLISFPDGLISTGDRAFEGAAPLFSPICLGFLIIRILDRTASCKLLEQRNVRIAQASSWRRAAKLGFMGRVQTVCCRIVTLHRVQSSYSVLAFSRSLKLQINWTLHNYTPITAECVGLNSPKTVVRDGPFNEKYNYSNRFSVSSAFIKETSAEF